MSKSIRVSDDTHAMLAALKAEDETFDDLLRRFIQERRDMIKEGAGLWKDTNAAEKAREKRNEMKHGVGSQ